jgi:hypothetical protein
MKDNPWIAPVISSVGNALFGATAWSLSSGDMPEGNARCIDEVREGSHTRSLYMARVGCRQTNGASYKKGLE